MRKSFGREIALLSLPVLLFGGLAWWRIRVPKEEQHVASPSAKTVRTGPPRVLAPVWKRIPVSARDVAAGYDFAVETRPEIVPRADLPSGVSLLNADTAILGKSELKFRRGGKWFTVKPATDKALVANESRHGFDKDNPSSLDLRLKVRLGDIPRDAQEIRLRGRLESQAFYRGLWPQGVQMPAAVQVNRYGLTENRLSPPFEVVIKGPSEPFPAPIVSHLEPVKVVEARFLRDSFGNFELQLWVKRQPWAIARNAEPKLSVWESKLFDANGREVEVFSPSGANQGNVAMNGWTSHLNQSKSVNLKDDEELLLRMSGNRDAPLGGWKNLKLPLRLEAKISDNDSWPTTFKGALREVKGYEEPKRRK